jgi:hypothetical protein
MRTPKRLLKKAISSQNDRRRRLSRHAISIVCATSRTCLLACPSLFHKPAKRCALVFLLAAWSVLAAGIDPSRYLAHVKYLASPELQGRGIDTPGLEKAAAYIERHFRELGLEAPAGSYSQSFPVVRSVSLGPGNRLEAVSGGQTVSLKLQEDFTPLNFSASGEASGLAVFAGYGITAPEYNYDDYAGIDVTGKIVLILPHEPQAVAAENARRHGARGLILINNFANPGGVPGVNEKFGAGSGPLDSGIPVAEVRMEVASEWLARSGRSLSRIREALGKQLKPQSFALSDSFHLAMSVDIRREVRTLRNVAGYLPGSTSEYVIVGAHYDHLGLGYEFSQSPELAGQIHPGADDNASGTAAILELARWFSSQPRGKRGILFLSFSGEESGMLGSYYYVEHPLLPLDRAIAMLNLDMIGRVRGRTVYAGSAASGSGFVEILDDVLPRHDLRRASSDAAESGASDYRPFKDAGLPVLYFMDGMTEDCHTPRDTWEKIDVPVAVDVVSAVADIAACLENCAVRPEFMASRPLAVARPLTKNGESKSGGGGLWFGIVPDRPVPIGVKFSIIDPGSPASSAGLKAGDILVEFDGKPVLGLADFGNAMAGKKPGDRVVVKILRNGAKVEASVELAERP